MLCRTTATHANHNHQFQTIVSIQLQHFSPENKNKCAEQHQQQKEPKQLVAIPVDGKIRISIQKSVDTKS